MVSVHLKKGSYVLLDPHAAGLGSSDHLVIPEASGDDDEGATMGGEAETCDQGVPRITEIQTGMYVVMGNYHGQMVPGFEHSLTIQASVISRQSEQVIVDVGSKSVYSAMPGHHGLERIG